MVESLRVDSQLGSWTHAHWARPPGDMLEGIVESVWDFEGVHACRRELMIPSGLLELVVQLDEPHRQVQPVVCEPFSVLCVDGHRTAATI